MSWFPVISARHSNSLFLFIGSLLSSFRNFLRLLIALLLLLLLVTSVHTVDWRPSLFLLLEPLGLDDSCLFGFFAIAFLVAPNVGLLGLLEVAGL